METKHLELLQTAIADVGGWNWWAAARSGAQG